MSEKLSVSRGLYKVHSFIEWSDISPVKKEFYQKVSDLVKEEVKSYTIKEVQLLVDELKGHSVTDPLVAAASGVYLNVLLKEIGKEGIDLVLFDEACEPIDSLDSSIRHYLTRSY